MSKRHANVFILGAVLAALVACGGLGTTTKSPPTNSSVYAVSVTCNPSSITAGATSQCNANVHGTGSYISAVTWSASQGTVSSTGLFTAPPTAGTVTVTAASVQNAAASGTAAVSVQSPPAVASIAITCNPATVAPNAGSQCNATVQGTGSYNSAVLWSTTEGVISAAGLLTAPAAPGIVNVTAVSAQDSAVSATTTVTVATVVPASRHVILVMEENQSYSTVVGNTTHWPALNTLIAHGALPTNYYADSHPSIGNYFMLTTGQLLTTDDNSTKVWNVDNIARRMLASNVSFRVYAEGIPQGYVGGDTGLYLIRHNPFAMLSDIASNLELAAQTIWPFTQFAVDLANGALPEFSYIVPDIDDDAHTGTPQQADAWLQSKLITPLSNDPAFQPNGDGILIVDFDEAATSDSAHGGGHVSPVFWGPRVQSGYVQTSATLYQHESMLRTIMEALSLANPPGAAASAPSMSEFFVQP